MYLFSSVAQSCPTLCYPMNCSTPGLPVHHQLPEFNQTHVHRVSDAIQPSHPLSSPSPPAPNPSQHQSTKLYHYKVFAFCNDLFRSYLNGLVVFPTFFNFSLNLAIRSSWSEPQPAPGLVFADCIELLHLWLQRI